MSLRKRKRSHKFLPLLRRKRNDAAHSSDAANADDTLPLRRRRVKLGSQTQSVTKSIFALVFGVLAIGFTLLFLQYSEKSIHIKNALRRSYTSKATEKVLLCFISAFYGDNEDEADKPMDMTHHHHEDIKYYFFVNQALENLTTPGWQKIVSEPLPYRRFITRSRWPKFRSFEHPMIQKQCDVVMYTDAATKFAWWINDGEEDDYYDDEEDAEKAGVVESLLDIAKKVKESEEGFAQPKHPKNRKGISDEFNQILFHEKDQQSNVDASMDWLREQNDFVDEVQIYQNTFFVYDLENDNFRRLSDFFWKRYSLEKDSWRDQPLWAYTLHHFSFTPMDLALILVGDRSRMGHGYHTGYKEPDTYNILCTAPDGHMTWGSTVIRCNDLKEWSNQCTDSVKIDLKPHSAVTKSKAPELSQYDATATIKSILPPRLEFGTLFVDIVDNYVIHDEDVPEEAKVIVQNDLHGSDQFPTHEYFAVEHWFNSYPADMLSDEPAFDIPNVTTASKLKLATVWTNKQEQCPSIKSEVGGISYDCIDETYDIESWYSKLFKEKNFAIDGKVILGDPKIGPGRLYYELFWMYDVLIIPVKKAFPPKLKYGNVQRAVSQMRSGIPVLLEINGHVMEDFMEKYNYTCAYTMDNALENKRAASKSKKTDGRYWYWTLEEAVEAMKSEDLRRKCQKEGLNIAQDYHPNKIAKKHLRALGYKGDFKC